MNTGLVRLIEVQLKGVVNGSKSGNWVKSGRGVASWRARSIRLLKVVATRSGRIIDATAAVMWTRLTDDVKPRSSYCTRLTDRSLHIGLIRFPFSGTVIGRRLLNLSSNETFLQVALIVRVVFGFLPLNDCIWILHLLKKQRSPKNKSSSLQLYTVISMVSATNR